jgi:hypothetical protein
MQPQKPTITFYSFLLSFKLHETIIMNLDTGYCYTALSETDALRLIVLDQSPDLEAPIHCTLIHTSLMECENKDAEPYIALSYV